jgi:aminopeptidase YwaD
LYKLYTIAFVLFPFLLAAQLEEARRITEQLCSPEFFGRGYVQEGMGKAADFLGDEFQKVGIEPLFQDSYFQHYTYDVNSFPGSMLLLQNGRELQPGIHYLVSANSPTIRGSLNYVVIDSLILTDENRLKDEIQKIYTGQKNAIFLDSRGLSRESRDEFNRLAYSLTTVATTLVTTDDKFTWSVGRFQLQNAVVQIQDSILAKNASYEVDIEAKLLENFEARNVGGVIRSKKRRAKTIVFCAHYDHLGGMGSEVYIPGANDNASGTAMLISLASNYVKKPSKYTIVFLAFSGEEAGLLGSEFFVENSPFELKRIKFVLNLDIMGSGEEGITVVNGTVYEKEFDLLSAINSEKGYLKEIKKRGETSNSDHYHFHQKGIPAFFIYTLGENKHYHDVFDTYDELSFSAYEDIIRLLDAFVRRF